MSWTSSAGLAVAVCVIVLQTALLYLLLRQHGLLLFRFDALNTRLDALDQVVGALRAGRQPPHPAPEPLAPGAPAPDFALPGLDGRKRRLRDFLGKPVVVLFFNPGCGFCADMAHAIGQLSERAAPLVLVSRGDAEENKRLASEHAWRCEVVLDSRSETSTAYRTQATPTGYLLDAQGRIASPLTIGAEALLTLLETGGSQNEADTTAPEATESYAAGRAEERRPRLRPVSESRINRNGLPAGTVAPRFDLPDLSGETRSLDEFLGKRVLLVFSDPTCGPCQELVPSLKHLHERSRHNGLQVVMVSKGKTELNRQKARDHNLEFPVLLQRGTETAKSYGIFATPVGYLIDEGGTLKTDVAIGKDAILQLAAA
jgi:peroxiredoxin